LPGDRADAFAPGRVNLIGEHTDYNQGLALPFAITSGVTVRGNLSPPSPNGEERVSVHAQDLGEHDEFSLYEPPPAAGWRAYARGSVAELARAGFPLVGVSLQISSDLPQGAGLSSSAALEVALCLALVELGRRASPRRAIELDRTEIAGLCARVENDWAGAHTGLLDQLASLYGAPDAAMRIDFSTLEVDPVPLRLGDWRLVLLDSGERHVNASSGYNERRAECAEACRLLGIESLREAASEAVARLPEPLRRRAIHVLEENERVCEAVSALRAGDLPAVGRLLNASHRSLRENYEVSTPLVEAAVRELLQAGASGARVVGGGFGGSVLGLLGPDAHLPEGGYQVHPGAGARLLEAEVSEVQR
jgi:galactokinase